MDIDELKRKLRELKKLEMNIRFKDMPSTGKKALIWDEFFSTGDIYERKVKYNLMVLLAMDRQMLKEVYEEYFYHVYFQKYRENGISFKDVYDPGLLSMLGLYPGAGLSDIKRRFRELAKKYHPDHGGDSEKMVELLETYRKLTE